MIVSCFVFFAIISSGFSGVFGLNFKLCCPYGHEYVEENKTCSPAPPTRGYMMTNLNLYRDMKQTRTVKAEVFNIINDPWCRNPSGVREIFSIDEEYFLQENDSLIIPNEQMVLNNNEFCFGLLPTNKKYVPIVCGMNETESAGAHYSKSIGMLISMPFLVMTLLVYACVPDLQNIHGKCLICYVISLLTAYVFLVCVQLDTSKTDSKFCSTAPFIIYFSFMVSFMWLHVMCIDIWWTFSGLRGYKGSAKKSEQKRFLLYSLYAWGVPLLMLAITLALQFAPNLPDWVVTPQIAVTKCWFPDDKTVGYYFYGPILLIILVNLGLFSYTTFKIWRVQRSTDQSMKKNESQRHGTDSDKQRYKLYLKLMFVFGVNWLMEIISWLADGPQWLWYVTDMCNALYGVFIFFIFVCKANVWKLVRKRYHVMMGRPYLAQTFAPTSSTRSTAVTSTSAGNGTQDSFALTTSTAA